MKEYGKDITIKEVIAERMFSNTPGPWEELNDQIQTLQRIVTAMAELLNEDQQLQLANSLTWENRYTK